MCAGPGTNKNKEDTTFRTIYSQLCIIAFLVTK